MLHKPIKFKHYLKLALVLSIWLIAGSAMAQSKAVKTTPASNKAKTVTLSPSKPAKSNNMQSISNKNVLLVEKNTAIQSPAEEARIARLKNEKANVPSKPIVEPISKSKNQLASTSSNAPANAKVTPATSVKTDAAANVAKDWAAKKIKLEANLKAKGYTQSQIDNVVFKTEKDMQRFDNQSKK